MVAACSESEMGISLSYKSTNQTLDQIRRKGLATLLNALGRAGMVRFLQQFETGRGDCAAERRKWVDETSLDELQALANKSRTKR